MRVLFLLALFLIAQSPSAQAHIWTESPVNCERDYNRYLVSSAYPNSTLRPIQYNILNFDAAVINRIDLDCNTAIANLLEDGSQICKEIDEPGCKVQQGGKDDDDKILPYSVEVNCKYQLAGTDSRFVALEECELAYVKSSVDHYYSTLKK